jgi:hypothetical protein
MFTSKHSPICRRVKGERGSHKKYDALAACHNHNSGCGRCCFCFFLTFLSNVDPSYSELGLLVTIENMMHNKEHNHKITS